MSRRIRCAIAKSRSVADADQVDVRLPIPVPCRLDEVTIHGFRLCPRVRWGRRPNLLVASDAASFNLRLAILWHGGRRRSQALAIYLDSRVTDALGGIGALGLLVLVWLMVIKPG